MGGLSYNDLTHTVIVLGLQIDCRVILFLSGEEIKLQTLLSNKGYLQRKVAAFSYRNESVFKSATDCRIILVLNIQISTSRRLYVSMSQYKCAHKASTPYKRE
jgi:environmental stress-induced protein Ves